MLEHRIAGPGVQALQKQLEHEREVLSDDAKREAQQRKKLQRKQAAQKQIDKQFQQQSSEAKQFKTLLQNAQFSNLHQKFLGLQLPKAAHQAFMQLSLQPNGGVDKAQNVAQHMLGAAQKGVQSGDLKSNWSTFFEKPQSTAKHLTALVQGGYAQHTRAHGPTRTRFLSSSLSWLNKAENAKPATKAEIHQAVQHSGEAMRVATDAGLGAKGQNWLWSALERWAKKSNMGKALIAAAQTTTSVFADSHVKQLPASALGSIAQSLASTAQFDPKAAKALRDLSAKVSTMSTRGALSSSKGAAKIASSLGGLRELTKGRTSSGGQTQKFDAQKGIESVIQFSSHLGEALEDAEQDPRFGAVSAQGFQSLGSQLALAISAGKRPAIKSILNNVAEQQDIVFDTEAFAALSQNNTVAADGRRADVVAFLRQHVRRYERQLRLQVQQPLEKLEQRAQTKSISAAALAEIPKPTSIDALPQEVWQQLSAEEQAWLNGQLKRFRNTVAEVQQRLGRLSQQTSKADVRARFRRRFLKSTAESHESGSANVETTKGGGDANVDQPVATTTRKQHLYVSGGPQIKPQAAIADAALPVSDEGPGASASSALEAVAQQALERLPAEQTPTKQDLASVIADVVKAAVKEELSQQGGLPLSTSAGHPSSAQQPIKPATYVTDGFGAKRTIIGEMRPTRVAQKPSAAEHISSPAGFSGIEPETVRHWDAVKSVAWPDLNKPERLQLQRLGWGQMDWDLGRIPQHLQHRWSALSLSGRAALKLFGWHEDGWDRAVISSSSNGVAAASGGAGAGL